MQSRRDHVQAYQFVTSRLASALTAADPGRGELPLRRSSLGIMWGLIIAVLLCGGFAVYGLINPGGATDWKHAGSILVEKETGNRYLYLNGTLYPTLNTASAMLYFADSNPGVFRSVSRSSLVGVPHGRAVGIPGAPDAIPTTQQLLPAQWALCAKTGSVVPSMRIDLSSSTSSMPLPTDDRVLVQDQNGGDYVIWHNTSYPIGSREALIELGLGDVPTTAVPTDWIGALRKGQLLTAPVIPGQGANGPIVGGQPTMVGELFSATIGSQVQRYVLRQDGIAPVNATVLALLEGAPNAEPPRQIDASDLAGLPMSDNDSLLSAVPDLVDAPTYRGDGVAVCVRQTSSGNTIGPGDLVTEQVSVPAGHTTVNVPAGRGMLAVSEPVSANQADQTYYLITDVGEKFALSQSGVKALQLDGTPVGMPAGVLAAMPSGPDLVTGAAVLTANDGEVQ